MAYQHGITVLEQATSLTAPIEGDSAIQVVFGTAPINLAEDPYSATNVPIIAYSYAEAVKQLGFSYDFKKYTLCQSIYASFQLYAVAPVIFVNVLDPKKHKKQNAASTVPVENMQATVQVDGILADTVSVKKDTESGTALKMNTDYVTEFDSNGYLVITLTATGAGKDAKSLSVTSTSIDPTAVTAADVVGGYNASTGAETGMELVRQIYPKFGVTPGLLLAPGWSHDPDVGLVLAAKCVEINGVFKCECIVDIDSTAEKGAKVYTEVKAKKEGAGVSSEHAYPIWPCFRVGSYILWASAVVAARTAYLDPCINFFRMVSFIVQSSLVFDLTHVGHFVGIQTVPGLVDQPLHCHVPGIHRVLGKDLVAVPELINRVVDVHLIAFHDSDLLLSSKQWIH